MPSFLLLGKQSQTFFPQGAERSGELHSHSEERALGPVWLRRHSETRLRQAQWSHHRWRQRAALWADGQSRLTEIRRGLEGSGRFPGGGGTLWYSE